jgi:hypothetical protein
MDYAPVSPGFAGVLGATWHVKSLLVRGTLSSNTFLTAQIFIQRFEYTLAQ